MKHLIYKSLSFFSVLTFIVLICVGCNNEINDENSKNFFSNRDAGLNYLTLISTGQNTNSVVVQDNSTFYSQDENGTISFFRKGVSTNDNNIILTSHDDNLIDPGNQHVLNPDLNSLYGSNVDYDVVSSNNSTIKSSSVYVPKKIKLTRTLEEITDGSIINWNSDSDNDNGVIIRVMYEPIEQTDMNLLYRNQDPIVDAIMTDDTGEYSFTNNFLRQFPKDGILNVTIYRGTINIDKDYPVINCYTSVRFSASYE